MPDEGLVIERTDWGWQLAGADAERFGLVNEYLSYLADRNYSPRTIRTYALHAVDVLPLVGRRGP